MGLQKGKTSDNQNDMGLVKCRHIMTAHGYATSKKCSKFLDIPPTWGYSVYGSRDKFSSFFLVRGAFVGLFFSTVHFHLHL